MWRYLKKSAKNSFYKKPTRRLCREKDPHRLYVHKEKSIHGEGRVIMYACVCVCVCVCARA